MEYTEVRESENTDSITYPSNYLAEEITVEDWEGFSTIKYYDKNLYSLFDIQNTMNLLKVIYQEVNYENIINYLKNDIKQIKTI